MTRRIGYGVFGALLAALASAPLAAQEPELVTDRPDQTESAEIVPKGRVQVELGAGFAADDEGFDTEALEAGVLVRIGLHERFELRVGSGWVDETVDLGRFGEISVDGVTDSMLSGKLLLASERDDRPQIALLAGASIPTGATALTSDEVDPSFRLALSHTLTERLGLGYNVGMEWASEPAPRGGSTTLSQAIYTVALGIGVGERTGVFVELFGEVPASAPGSPAHSVDAGVTHQVRPNLQLDLAAGWGLSEAATDWFLGLGLSVRLPR